MKLFNATLHAQSPQNINKIEAEGFTLVNEKGGFLVDVEASFGEVKAQAQEVIDEAINLDAEGVLLGGLTSATIALYNECIENNLEVYEVVTERTRDDQDRFVFNFVQLRQLT